MCSCNILPLSSVMATSTRMTRRTACGPGGHRDTLSTISCLVSSEVSSRLISHHPGMSTIVTCLPATSPCLFTHCSVLTSGSNSSLPRMVFPAELFAASLFPSSTILKSERWRTPPVHEATQSHSHIKHFSSTHTHTRAHTHTHTHTPQSPPPGLTMQLQL